MRKRIFFAAGLVLAGAAAGVGVWAAEPCRPLDRLFGRSGCAGAFTIQNLASLRSTLAFDPARPDLIYAAGVSHDGYASRDRLRSRSTIVALAFPRGSERWRRTIEPNGMPETLAISPDGSHAAFSCNRLASCDFAPAIAPGGDRDAVAPVAVVDLAKAEGATDGGEAAKAQWIRTVPIAAVPVDADGRAAAPRFSTDGNAVAANGASWTLGGDPAPSAGAPAPQPVGWNEAALAGGAGAVAADRRSSALIVRNAAGAELRRMPLDLPASFEAALRAPLAVSPDGGRVAVLSRRFSGPGEPRAILQVFRLADGLRLSRVAIEVDVSPALLFGPDGATVLVATAPEPAVRASTTVRFYRAADGG